MGALMDPRFGSQVEIAVEVIENRAEIHRSSLIPVVEAADAPTKS